MTSFQFFYSFYYRANSYFHWPTLLSNSIHMNCDFPAKMDESLETNFFAWSASEPFLTSFHFVYSFYYRPNSYFYWPTLLSKSTHINCVSSAKNLTESLGINFFIWNGLLLAANSSKECTPNHFWIVFSFSTHIAIGQTFTSAGSLFCPNRLTWTVPTLQGWPCP